MLFADLTLPCHQSSTTTTTTTSGLPTGWEVRHSNSKNLPYYFNPSTKESRWEPPSGTDPDRLKLYMGEHHSNGNGSSSQQQQAGSATAASGETSKIRAAHLLVKHRDSRRPASWREAQITRSKDEAMGIIEGYQRRIQGGEIGMGELATTESDCSSARKRGDL